MTSVMWTTITQNLETTGRGGLILHWQFASLEAVEFEQYIRNKGSEW